MAGPRGDSETVRRNNRGLLLSALRVAGPLPRTQLAGETGLSHATITAITQDMLAQGILADLPDGEKTGDGKGRGRPAVRLGFNRSAAALALVEIDVNRARFSLVDYGGTLIDRIEKPDPGRSLAQETAAQFVSAGIAELRQRNPAEATSLRRIAVSLQGILDRDGVALKWSPVPRLAGQDLAAALAELQNVPVTLHKRGRLLAEGTRWLDPSLRDADVATVFVGSTVAMGLSSAARQPAQPDGGATEFGHMNHMPGGAQSHYIFGTDKSPLTDLCRGDQEMADHASAGQCRRHGDGARTTIIEREQAVSHCRNGRGIGYCRKTRATGSQRFQMRVELGHIQFVVGRRAARETAGVGLPRLDHVVVHQRRNFHRAVALVTARRQPR